MREGAHFPWSRLHAESSDEREGVFHDAQNADLAKTWLFSCKDCRKKGGRPVIRLLLSMSPIACCAQTASICQAVRTLHLAACRSSAHPFFHAFRCSGASRPRAHSAFDRLRPELRPISSACSPCACLRSRFKFLLDTREWLLSPTAARGKCDTLSPLFCLCKARQRTVPFARSRWHGTWPHNRKVGGSPWQLPLPNMYETSCL